MIIISITKKKLFRNNNNVEESIKSNDNKHMSQLILREVNFQFKGIEKINRLRDLSTESSGAGMANGQLYKP